MKKLIILVLLSAVGFYAYKTVMPSGNACIPLQRDEKMKCIAGVTDSLLAKDDIKGALAFIHDYKLKDPEFYATDCHGMAHKIGDAAYKLYKKGVSPDLGQDSNICGYGFYHAFTSSFVLAGEGEDARNYCMNMQKIDESKAIACFHGIGHGAVYDYNEDYGIKEPKEIIKRSVALCDSVLTGTPGLSECITGVYDGIGDVVLNPEYKNLTPTTIYSYCEGQRKEYIESCYENVSHLVSRKTGFGFAELVSLVMKSNIKYKKAAIEGLATIYVVDLKGQDITPGVKVCLNLPANIAGGCIQNMVFKLIADAPEGARYQAARNFCTKEAMSKEAASTCFKASMVNLMSYHSQDQVFGFCNADPDTDLKDLCLAELNSL